MRLPKSILPLHYELYLFPELETGMFSGKVDIEVDSQEARDYFLAHVKYLEIIDSKLTRNGNKIDLIEAMEYEPNEFYVMRTRDIVPAGKYVMHFGKRFLKAQNFEICLAETLIFCIFFFRISRKSDEKYRGLLQKRIHKFKRRSNSHCDLKVSTHVCPKGLSML